MHFESSQTPTTASPSESDSGPWWKGLTRYHWFVLIVASLGWLFDTMDQQLFNLARKPAITQLIGGDSPATFDGRRVRWLCHLDLHDRLGNRRPRASASWATGSAGAKTMLLTILLYSAFTGLSALSTGF